MQFTLAVLLSGVAALVASGVAIALWRRETGLTSTALAGFNLAVAVWAGGNALQVASIDLGTKLLWVNVQYVGIAAVPVTVFAFAAAINGLERWTRPRRLALIAAPLVVLVLLSWTNEYHHLVRLPGTTTETVGGVVTIRRSFGPAFWAGWAYSNTVNVVSTLLVFRAVVYTQSIFQRGTVAIVIGAVVPWVAHMLYLSGVSPVEPEAFFAVTGLAFAYGTVVYRDSNLRPVARDEVLELLDDGVLVVGDDGHVIDSNGAARDLLGESDIVGSPVTEVLSPHPELLSGYGDGTDRSDLPLGEGDRRVDLRIASFPGPSGAGRDVLVLHDVTTLRQHERDLRRQNERLEHIRSTLAHDLRNPLNVAQGYLELVRDAEDDPVSAHHETIDQIDRAHGRIESIIDDVLAVASTGEIETEPVDLSAMARDAWQSIDAGDVEVSIEDGTTVEADPRLLQHLLENLFANAVEHGTGGSSVRVGRLDDVVRSNGSDTVGFYVEDDGPGIPDEQRNQVFDHGYSGAGGTGLGLAIVEEIAESHDWGVRLTESESGGARFEFVDVS